MRRGGGAEERSDDELELLCEFAYVAFRSSSHRSSHPPRLTSSSLKGFSVLLRGHRYVPFFQLMLGRFISAASFSRARLRLLFLAALPLP